MRAFSYTNSGMSRYRPVPMFKGANMFDVALCMATDLFFALIIPVRLPQPT